VNRATERLEFQGGAGAVEVLRDAPAEEGHGGVAVIAHPHPLFGGTMDNKVVQTLARAFVQCGWVAVRFNFRGVGRSAGVHDEGRGELEDFLAVLHQFAPEGAIALAGFSFGAFVAGSAAASLSESRDLRKLVLVGTAVSRFAMPALPEPLHARSLLVHGEQDDTVPLAGVFDWARPQNLPVTVVPGATHFFHGQLPLLRSLVVRHLDSTSS
jgi:alpha/beta superfamily hydrolase